MQLIAVDNRHTGRRLRMGQIECRVGLLGPLKPVRCGLVRRDVTVFKSTAPVGHTKTHAPQAWH